MNKFLIALATTLFLTGCSKDETPSEVVLPEVTFDEPTNGFTIDKMQWFHLQPKLKNPDNVTYTWLLNGKIIATTLDLMYVFAQAGTYKIDFRVKNNSGEIFKKITVNVKEKTYLNGVKNVFEFFPAPGQFTNALPEATVKDTDETMRKKAETALTTGSLVSLGGFGGYIVMGFDHTIINKEGNDFIVLGNAFSNWAEPGIIMVSSDVNNNGKADDEWYEIAGSEHNKPTTIKNYELTYYQPKIEPENPSEPNYIRWTDNQGQTGYISKNTYHSNPFYPTWKGTSITLKGTFLKANLFDKSGTGTYWVNPAYDWGYADNWSNTDEKAQIDISWAVDKKGNPAKLQGINFIKVYNSNRAEGGWLGEVSTEVSGFKDLNL